MHICYTYTFQIMKLILILDKENQTKHTVRILNDDFFYWGGKVIQTYLALRENVIAP